MEKVFKLFGWLLLLCMVGCTTDDELVDIPEENLLKVPQFSRGVSAPTATIAAFKYSGTWKWNWELYDPDPQDEDNYWESYGSSGSLTDISKLVCLVPERDVSNKTIVVNPKVGDVLQWAVLPVSDKAADGRYYFNLENKLASICVKVNEGRKKPGLQASYKSMAHLNVLTGEYTYSWSPEFKTIGSLLQEDGEYYTYTFPVVPQTFTKNSVLLRYIVSRGQYSYTYYEFKADKEYDLKAGQTLHIHAYGDGWTSRYVNTYVSVTSVQITSNDFELELQGTKEKQLAATYSPSNASEPQITWSSGNPAVATVSANGKVTGISRGEAVITAKSKDGSSASVKVTVKDKATGVTVGVSTMEVGDVESLNPQLNTTDEIKTIAVSPANIITIDNNYNVTALAPGVATVKITTEDGAVLTVQIMVASAIEDWESGGSGTGTLNPNI